MSIHRHKRLNIARWMVLLAVAGVAGCATPFDLSKSVPWEIPKVGTFETPMQVVAFWTDAVQNQSDKPRGIRGFGGRLYFYGKDPNKPVKVKGSLVVYAFDETNRDPKNVIPDKKYIFTAEQFQKKYSKSSLGDSYSVWLPWDEVGGPQKQVSLVVRFTDEKGEMIASDEARQLLPGVVPEKKTVATDQNSVTVAGQTVALPVVPPMPFGTNPVASSGVQTAAYQQPIDVTGGMPKTFSVMQASSAAAVSKTAVADSAAQNLAEESYGVNPSLQHMRTTTISVPQEPRPRFNLQNGNAPGIPGMMPSADLNPALQSPMLGVNQVPTMQNQMQLQNQMPVQMQPPMQTQMNNQGQMFSVGQMPRQNQNLPSPYGSANFMAPTTPGTMNPATNGLPASVGTPTSAAARSELEKLRALGAPVARLDSDHGQWPQSPLGSPSNLPFAPQSAPLQ